jgi:LDH2 family malate/lactate/ureidoglycolate dehydrogenase
MGFFYLSQYLRRRTLRQSVNGFCCEQPTLGTNPISLAAPAKGGDSLVLDMATTAVALGKVEINDRKGMDIPVGWGVDASGKVGLSRDI